MDMSSEHSALGTRNYDVHLPHSGETYVIQQPQDLDRLLDDVADDPEQNLPYWAEIWPSGVALADAIALHPASLRGVRTLEIGAGIGITATAALRAGADLTVTDYAEPALKLCGQNALANAGREPTLLQFNWRSPSDEFLALDPFPVVLAADVLYESRDVEPLLALLNQVVAPNGLLWLAEPGRPVARRFVERARQRGWAGEQEDHHGPWPDPKDAGITVSLYRLRRDPLLT